ncbi:MAG: tetratricopeptide repeat protein [Candidatus Aminicenantes bacterium]|nr:tetratricopeptide repeat protein [Candidatus Aminicenantes bacterium]
MKAKKQVNKGGQRLFKLPENRDNFHLFYKFISHPAKGLCLCRVPPEEQAKIFRFIKGDPLLKRIHFIDMAEPPGGVSELRQTLIERQKKSAGNKNIYFIHNIENCISLSQSTPKKFFREMNLIRDFFMHFDALFVFFMTESSLKVMIREAFDFYDWMKVTFTFVPESKDSFLQPIEIEEEEERKYSNPQEKIAYLENSIRDLSDDKDKAGRLFELGMLYSQADDYDAALERILEALKIEEKYADKASIAKGYSEIGRIYRAKGDVDRALEFALKAAGIFKTHNDTKNLAAAYNIIFRVYRDIGDLDMALKFGLKGLNISWKNNNLTGMAHNYNNLGAVYFDRGDVEKALKFFNRAVDLFEKNNDRAGLTIAYDNIGRIYRSLGDQKRASDYFKRASYPDLNIKVFISYVGEDRETAFRLASLLREDGIAVWLDEQELIPGAPIAETIIKAIDQCPVFIPLISRNSRRILVEGRLKYHIREWEMAINSQKSGKNKVIIPVIVDSTNWIYDGFQDINYLRIPGGERTGGYEKLKHVLRDVQQNYLENRS